MAFTRIHSNCVFSCDSCEETFEANAMDFHEAWAAAQRDGWKAKKIGRDWVHACPRCEVN